MKKKCIPKLALDDLFVSILTICITINYIIYICTILGKNTIRGHVIRERRGKKNSSNSKPIKIMAIRSNINDKIEMIQINSVPKKNPE